MKLSHITWNASGLALPLLVAVFTIPHIISRLGTERFGLLALAWGLIGYASALDMGIGRALTQMVSQLRGEGLTSRIPSVLATAARITLIAGLAGGILIAIVALSGAATWLSLGDIPTIEVTYSILLLAVALPAQSMSATYRGLNEAFLNFKGISILRIGLGAISFGGPYFASMFTKELPWIVATLVVSRLASLLVYRWLAKACLRDAKIEVDSASYSSADAISLYSFGGWLTVSSIIGPMLTQADRFLIAYVVSAAAVTAYVLPYEVAVQSLILVGAITSVIFPTLSKLLHEKPNEWRPYFEKWLVRVAVLMLCVCIMVALMLPFVMELWIKDNLQHESIIVGQILCIGVFANSIGSMYYALLHAKGRADIPAKIHMIELPLFVAALFFLLHAYGVQGAAWAWVARMVLDAMMLAYAKNRLYRNEE